MDVEKLKQLAKQDINNYKIRREEFYNNPVHWDNNKRRHAGLPVLRGDINRCRSKVFRSSILSSELFEETEKEIDNAFSDYMFTSSYFDEFVKAENCYRKVAKESLQCTKSILDEIYEF